MEAVSRGHEVHFGDLPKEIKIMCLIPVKFASVGDADPSFKGESPPPGSAGGVPCLLRKQVDALLPSEPPSNPAPTLR